MGHIDSYIAATRLICREQGATIAELSDELEVSERTVYKIIERLSNMGFPIYDTQDPNHPRRNRYHSSKNFTEYLPDLKFSESEKDVFNYLVNNAPNIPAIEEEAKRLFNKLEILASERGALIATGYNKIAPIVSAKSIQKMIDSKKTAEMTKSILSIIKSKHWMDINYKSMARSKSFLWKNLFPLIMFVYNGDSYVYVITKKGDIKMLAIERISEVVVSAIKDEPKHDYNIKELLSDPFGIILDHEGFVVRLHIARSEAVYIKQKAWPSSVRIIDNEDESIIFEASTRSLYGCRSWILEKTPNIKILEPKWLRDSVIEAFKSALEDNSAL